MSRLCLDVAELQRVVNGDAHTGLRNKRLRLIAKLVEIEASDAKERALGQFCKIIVSNSCLSRVETHQDAAVQLYMGENVYRNCCNETLNNGDIVDLRLSAWQTSSSHSGWEILHLTVLTAEEVTNLAEFMASAEGREFLQISQEKIR